MLYFVVGSIPTGVKKHPLWMKRRVSVAQTSLPDNMKN